MSIAHVVAGLIALAAAAAAVSAGRFVSRRTGPGLAAAFLSGFVGLALEVARILVVVRVFNALGSPGDGVPWLVALKLFNVPIVPAVAFFTGAFGVSPRSETARPTPETARPS